MLSATRNETIRAFLTAAMLCLGAEGFCQTPRDAATSMRGPSTVPAGNALSQRPRLVPELGHNQWIQVIAVSPDGRMIATGGGDGWVILWDAATLKEVRRLRDPLAQAYGANVSDLRFSADGRWVAARVGSFFRGEEYYVWEAATGRYQPLQVPTARTPPPGPDRAPPPDPPSPAGESPAASGKPEMATPEPPALHLESLAFIPQDNRVVAAYRNNLLNPGITAPFVVGVFSLDDGQQRVVCPGHSAAINGLAVSPNRQWIVSVSDDATARLWSVADGHELCRLPWKNAQYAPPAVYGALFGAEPAEAPSAPTPVAPFPPRPQSTAGPTFRSRVCAQFAAMQTAAETERPAGATFPTPVDRPKTLAHWRLSPVTGVAIAPKGTQVALGTQAGAVGLFDLPSGDVPWMCVVGSPIDRLTFSPDGSYLVVRTSQAFHVVDARRGQIVQSHSRSNAIRSVVFTPDGARLITGGDDGQVRRFDAVSGKLIDRLTGPRQTIDAVTVVPGQDEIVAHCTDGFFWRWEGQTGATCHWSDTVESEKAPPEMPPGPPPPAVPGSPAAPATPLFVPRTPSGPPAPPSPPGPGGGRAGLEEPGRRAGRVRAVLVSAADPGEPPVLAADDDSEGPRAHLGRSWADPFFGTLARPVSMSNSGRWMVTPNAPPLCARWDVWKPKSYSVQGNFDLTPAISAISDDGQWVLVRRPFRAQGDFGKVQETRAELRTASGQLLRAFRFPEFDARPIAFSGDKTWLVSGGMSGSLDLWSTADGARRGRLEGLEEPIACVRFSPDNRTVAAGSQWGALAVWDVATTRLLRRLTAHSRSITALAFAPDGKTLVSGSEDETARCWDLATGRELARYEAGGEPTVAEMVLAGDGRLLMLYHSGVMRILRGVRGEEVSHTAALPSGTMPSACGFSPDGRQAFLAGSSTPFSEYVEGLIIEFGYTLGKTTLTSWDTAAGRAAVSVESPLAAGIHAAAFLPRQNELTTVHTGGQTVHWRGGSVAVSKQAGKKTDFAMPLAITPDLRRVVVAPRAFGAAEVWDAAGAASPWRLPHDVLYWMDALDDLAQRTREAFSPDGQRIVAREADDKDLALLDMRTGRTVCRMTGHVQAVHGWAFSPDGKSLATAGADGTVRIWDAESGAAQKVLSGHKGEALCVAFWPKGGWVASGGTDGMVRVWHLASGQESSHFLVKPPDRRLFTPGPAPPPSDPAAPRVDLVRFSPDGSMVLTFASAYQLWETATGRPVATLEGHYFTSVAFSPDSRWVLGWDSVADDVVLWSTTAGKIEWTLPGHAPGVWGAGFLAEGRLIFTCSGDGRTRLWDVRSGRDLCTFMAFTNGAWAVVDPQGRYDTSGGGDAEGLHWIVGNEPIGLAQLKDRYYDPGLLAKILGFNKEPLRKVEAFSAPKLYPEVALVEPTAEKPQLGVRLAARDGGIGRVVVKINGKELRSEELPANTRGAALGPDAKRLDFAVDLSRDPRLKPGEENVVEVQVYNAEGYLRSRGYRVIYASPAAAEIHRPQLWALVAGTAHYRTPDLELRYAAKDADDFGHALRIAATRFLGADRVHLVLLSTTILDSSQQPARANLLAALEQFAAKAKRDDILVVYLAGHGVNYGGQDGDFYYLTCDAVTAELTDPQIRAQTAISSRELTDVVLRIPALKQVLILDTCASGRLIEKLAEKRDVPSSQVRALERIKDRTGSHILAGCTADQASYEASPYGQGLLTHSLLLGMRGAALREEQFVDVVPLFSFAENLVPQLAKNVGGIQQPTRANPGGQSFDIGQLTQEDKAQIPLQAPRPLVVRASFQDEKRPWDQLGLGRRVNEQLRDASAGGRNAPFVFVDAEEFPGACAVGGRYRVEDKQVVVNVILVRDEKELAQFQVTAATADLAGLAAQIVRQTETRLAQ